MIQKRSRSIRRLLYSLKKGYGYPITFYRVVSETLNVETGVRTPVISYHKVDKVIILPSILQRRFESDTLTKDFHYGSYYDTALRRLIVDPRDFSDIKNNDYFIWEGKRYEVSQVHDLENDAALLIIGRFVEGSIKYEITDFHVETNLQFTQTQVST